MDVIPFLSHLSNTLCKQTTRKACCVISLPCEVQKTEDMIVERLQYHYAEYRSHAVFPFPNQPDSFPSNPLCCRNFQPNFPRLVEILALFVRKLKLQGLDCKMSGLVCDYTKTLQEICVLICNYDMSYVNTYVMDCAVTMLCGMQNPTATLSNCALPYAWAHRRRRPCQ